MAYSYSILFSISLLIIGFLSGPSGHLDDLVSSLAGPAPSQSSPLAAAFSRFENDEQLRYGIASLCVLDGRTGKLVFARNEHTGLQTASTLKTLTSITSLSLLGPDYRFGTALDYTGAIGPDGVLRGDLIIRGNGDPTLGSSRWPTSSEEQILGDWVTSVKAAGIRRIEGRVIGDQSRMSTQTLPGGWQWDDIGNYYGAGSSALNWRENQFDILLEPTRVGGPVRMLGTRPNMNYLKFINELQTGPAGTGDRAYVYLPPYREIAYLRGTFALDVRKSAISAAVPDPAYECAYRFLQALESGGIPVTGSASTDRRLHLEGIAVPEERYELLVTLSPPLTDIIAEFNEHSINLYGESLVKRMAIESGKQGSTPAGIQTIREFWAENGIDSASLVLDDGSGLSPGNRVTTTAMAQVLQAARQSAWFDDFYQSLPLQNGMRMKSGYIQGVRGYAGYHVAADGREYTFAFLVNNFSGSPAAVRRKMWSVLDHLK